MMVGNGGGECGELFRTFDWAHSPLGPRDQWPSELRTLTNVMLGSVQPMLIVWGPQQITLYNDGYAAMCGNRHPEAFGHPFRDLWFDIWDQVDPIISAAYAGQGTSMDDIQFTMYRKGYPEETHFSFSYTPVRDPWGTVLGMFCACSEITGEVMMRREQETQRERFMHVFELSPSGIAMLSGERHVFAYANEAYYAMIGNRDIIGKPVADAVNEVVRQGFIDILDRVYRTGKPFTAKDMPIELNRGADGEKQDRIIDFSYQPMRDPDGSVGGILVQAIDVTDIRAEERHRELLSHELGHRLKNQLAMVQAIASQTLRTAPDMKTARRTLSDRISVLSYAHDAILQGGNGSSKVGDLVDQMIALHNDPNERRIHAAGPNLKIGSRPSLSLSLILHELATNAVKHGSLSLPQGRVDLTWGVTGPHHDRFELMWKEIGGPPVAAPASAGSGTRLINTGLNGAADCKVDLAYEPDGVRLRLSAELAGFQQEH